MRFLLAAVPPVLAASLSTAFAAQAQEDLDRIEVLRRPLPTMGLRALQRAPDPAASAPETVKVGYLVTSADPNKVGVGGKWDFDTDVAGTDSSQFWRFVLGTMAADAGRYPTPQSRPTWYYDYGNNINQGDHELWKARLAAGRSFRRTGLAGVWHADPMTGIAGSSPIRGSRSAWCGLRLPGDYTVRDELTGNAYNSDQLLMHFFGGSPITSAFPGFVDQWDQILYREFPTTGAPISLSFRLRAHLSTLSAAANDVGGSGWFNPDPGNFIGGGSSSPADSLMLWVGAPRPDGSGSGVHDKVRKWLSEILWFDLPGTGQPQKLFAISGKVPVTGGDTLVTVTIPDFAPTSPTVRVAFQVKTNRTESDLIVPITGIGGFNTVDGAALIDDINLDGGPIDSDFEDSLSVRPRALLASDGTETLINPATAWITTGRPPPHYGHVHNVNDLPYEDVCGGLDGFDARVCNLSGNVVVQSDHDDGHRLHELTRNWFVSPTICLTGPRAAAQGISPTLRNEASYINVQTDFYSGLDDPFYSGLLVVFAVRYMGEGLPQPQAPQVPAWSPFASPSSFSAYGSNSPLCFVLDSGYDLQGYVPLPSIDSLQIAILDQTRCARFFATACGDSRGHYWDNIQLQFIKEAPPIGPVYFALTLLGDTFPFDEAVTPGSDSFDTTTALVQTGLNLAADAGGEGVVPGDTLAVQSPWSGNDSRVDLVFRILPGPGNYSVKGNRDSPLWKIPSNPALGTTSAGDGSFWGEYMAANGQVGSANGHTSTHWDPHTWNSARMDSAQGEGYPYLAGQISPIVSRAIGLPWTDTWSGSYHENDEKGGWVPAPRPLALARPLCFLVNQAGPVDNTNICCSTSECMTKFAETYPPSGYDPLTPTTSFENNKIIPDGLLTPGSHVEYFFRRSAASAPGHLQSMRPDTTRVIFQGFSSEYDADLDLLRWEHMDVLPDLWKDARFGGPGLACLLYVDAADRLGVEPAVRGALDSLGYGVDNGAGRGWKATPTSSSADDPSGFVAANLGQNGLAYDQFDITGAEFPEGDRPGCRLASPVAPELAGKQCKQGPTLAMLDFYYRAILWDSGPLATGTMHDGASLGEQSNDAKLIRDWLALGALGHEKAFWGAGNGLANDLAGSAGDAPALLADMGAALDQDDYFVFSGNHRAAAVYQPLGSGFHPGRRYGISNDCFGRLDVVRALDPEGTGAQLAARYEQFSDRGVPGIGSGPYGASVYRPADPASNRFFRTLLDGFSLGALGGWGGALDSTTAGPAGLTANDYARFAWMNDVLSTFNVCARVGPTVGIGDLPGIQGTAFVHGAYPNPARGAADVRFSLTRPTKVTIRFYDVAGRLVHEALVEGVAGPNSYRWDGASSNRRRAAPGVYFYRLSGTQVEFENNRQRMVLLGSSK